jgi:hypothetical protein
MEENGRPASEYDRFNPGEKGCLDGLEYRRIPFLCISPQTKITQKCTKHIASSSHV